MADGDSGTGGYLGTVVYAAFLLASVFVGPFEAVVGLVLYWLFGHDGDGPGYTERG